MKNPKVTVLMPVYNGEKYLSEAIESILNQTFTDFELLIIDDGSTDRSVKIIQSYTDSRIKLIKNHRNLKVSATLNKGIDLAQGEYIVRMDCDDISFPERIEKQVAFMDSNIDVGICGSWFQFYQGFDNTIIQLPIDSESVKARLLFHCVVNHPTVMIRKSVLVNNHLYYGNRTLEDYDLWIRASAVTKITNIPEVLLKYRIHENQVTIVYDNLVQRDVDKQIYSLLRKLGIKPTKNEWKLHKQIKFLIPTEYMKGKRPFPPSNYHQYKKQVVAWFNKIIANNEKTKNFSTVALKNMFDEYIYDLEQLEQQVLSDINEIAKNKALFLWGTGEVGKNFLGLLKSMGIEIKGFIDNSKERWGNTIEGYEIFSPERLKIKNQENEPFIIITSMYFNEISKDIQNMGFKLNKDYKYYFY